MRLLSPAGRKTLFQALIIIAVTWWIYWPALHGGWIWDDVWYVTTNPLMHGWTGLWKFWYRPGSWVEYYPIQETVQWTQWRLWGENTLGYHLTNVALHIVNALLVWRLFAKLDLRYAWLGGLIFAIHPVQVESVAYISELKNTLSLPFFLLSMAAWIDYDQGRSKSAYQKSVAFFLIAMLCKVSMSPFPVVILLYAWWKRDRIDAADLKACLPFLLISAVLSFMTIWAGNVYETASHHQISGVPLGGILSRINAAGLIATVYFARCFLPVDVVYIYPQWNLHPHSLLEYLPWLGWLAVFCWLWGKRREWGRHALLGLGFFFAFLLPFVGFIAASYMNFVWVMDHMLYIPIIGLIGLVVAGLEGCAAQLPTKMRSVTLGVIASCLFLLAGVGHVFAGLFAGQEIFWTHILQRNPAVWLARDNLGCYLSGEKRYPEAVAQLRIAAALRPDDAENYYNLGFALDKLGQSQAAQEQFRAALKLEPNDVDVYATQGEIALRKGDFPTAEALFRKALKIAPENEGVCTNLGTVLVQTGRPLEALPFYERAITDDPDAAKLHYNYGNALSASGDFAKAVDELEASIALDPAIAMAHENLGANLARLGWLPEAIKQFRIALQLTPDVATEHDNLGFALGQAGQFAAAREQFQLALGLDPGDQIAQSSLAKLEQFELQQNVPNSR